MKSFNFVIAAFAWLLSGGATAAVVGVFESAGDLATVTSTRDSFRAAIGGGTVAGANGSFGGVRREINWDGVPDIRADPSLLPADFFNVTSPRGVVFNTPGTGFMVSANAGQAVPIEFGFGLQLQPFSSQRLFTALNSTTTGVLFFVAGTATAATTSAFGIVFSDVDVADSTRIEFFDAAGNSIFGRDVLASGGDQQFSFLGITLDTSLIRSVRIRSGSATIVSNGVTGISGDLVVMDDFLYAEPIALTAAVPEPETYAMLLAGLGLVGFVTRRRARWSQLFRD